MCKVKLIKLTLEIETVIIGERIKGGVYRPCQTLIPSTTIEGALKRFLGIEIPAVGYIDEETCMFDEFTYSVRDKFLNSSKLPLITSYLRPKNSNEYIRAFIYIPYDEGTSLEEELKGAEFQLGALKTKGFGKTQIKKSEIIESEVKQGILKVKLLENEAKYFHITPIESIYGFLFKPDELSIEGVYTRALFPGSLVKAPVDVLLKKEETYYDNQIRGSF